MAYATVDDLEARWRPLSEDEAAKSETLLDDAGVMLASLVTVDGEDEQQLALLRVVSCSMVMRAMMASESETFGLSQVDYGMGPFSQAAHFANPSGDLYLTAQEKRLLGVGDGYIIDLRAKVGDADA